MEICKQKGLGGSIQKLRCNVSDSDFFDEINDKYYLVFF